MAWAWADRLLGRLAPREAGRGSPSEEVCALIEQARAEWEAACVLFAEAAEPDLVDHAVHRLLAAEKRFNHLLREARRLGVQVDALGRGL